MHQHQNGAMQRLQETVLAGTITFDLNRFVLWYTVKTTQQLPFFSIFCFIVHSKKLVGSSGRSRYIILIVPNLSYNNPRV